MKRTLETNLSGFSDLSKPGVEPTTYESVWTGGWYAPATRLESPNCSARSADACIDLIVVHSISLPPGEFDNDRVQQLFTNTLDWEAHPYFKSIEGLRVSSHFFITRDGVLWQFVSCDKKAWHAGQSSHLGRQDCNDFSIGIELQGLEGDSFELVQYRVLRDLCWALAQRYPIAHMTGHEQVAPGRKRDPGPGFDWHFFHDGFSDGKNGLSITLAPLRAGAPPPH